ncbi:MAG: 4Fe-4S binding protein [Anaerolineae bacterium]|nr:4Fe-4S binding protein [Anaerolineae bacterium]
MSQDVYQRLAERLDAIPNGFPATESGVELRLLAKIFAPEEALLASVMRLSAESAQAIAARAGVDPDAAYQTLKGMVRKGLILLKRSEGTLLFRLMPFAVGFYEEQLPRMDAEMAALVEEYFQEAKGMSLSRQPSIHRVIPVEEAVPFDLEIFPHERATELVEQAKSWGVRDCICRVQQRLIGKGCDHPIENCLILAPVENAFGASGPTRAISKEEALQILCEAEEAGLVHSTGNYRDQHYYICNCCSCCCGVLRGLTEFDVPNAVAHSDFYAVVDADVCIGCGDCVERCQFGALSVPGDVCVVAYTRCVGCGVCAVVCPADALSLLRRPEEDVEPLPANLKEWMVQRAQARGVSIFDIL